MSPGYTALKERQRRERHRHPPGLALRVHRALSWLHRAEQCEDDDGRFIFLWIAFNAAYANELYGPGRTSETRAFSRFLRKLVDLDRDERLYDLIWKEFPGPLRVLLDNQYVFEPFWAWHRGELTEAQWRSRFERDNRKARRALAEHRTVTALSVILQRMYTLRNQMVHGGATFGSRVNRDQVRDCTAFLGKLVPHIIVLMMDHPETLWGDAAYPVVED